MLKSLPSYQPEVGTYACPCCGSLLAPDEGASDIRLTRQQNQLLQLFIKRPGYIYSTSDIIFHLYGGEDEPRFPENIVHSQISKINKLFGIKIIEGMVGRSQGGYRLKSQEKL